MSPTSPTTFSWGASSHDVFGVNAPTIKRRGSSPQLSPIDGKSANWPPTGSSPTDDRGRRPSAVPIPTADDPANRSQSVNAAPRRPSLAQSRRNSSSWKQRTRSIASVGGAGRRASLFRQGSVGNLAAETADADIPEALQTKCNIMVQHLYHQLRERLWLSDSPVDEGVVLKINRDAYTCCPGTLAYQQEGFLEAIEGLNVKVSQSGTVIKASLTLIRWL